MKPIKYLCFDMDGVIIDSEPAHFNAFRIVIKNILGTALTKKDYLTYFAGKTDKQGFADYLSAMPSTPASINDLLVLKSQTYQTTSVAKINAYQSTISFLKTIPSTWTCALVTSSSRQEADYILDRFAIRDYFDVIVSGDDVSKGKPDPDCYLLAANLLNASPLMCTAIEDSPLGIESAISAGMKCIALTTTHANDELKNATIVAPQLTTELFPL